LDDRWFEVAVIPVTLERTTLGAMEIGAHVNLETDMIAKYVESLLKAGLSDLVTRRPANSLC
ncbi:MAG TPA: hypothetical protein PLF26_19855, partial [Blastocatellia bacterium]|nr:hypothetical protein [Blastocatellia bacterium]